MWKGCCDLEVFSLVKIISKVSKILHALIVFHNFSNHWRVIVSIGHISTCYFYSRTEKQKLTSSIPVNICIFSFPCFNDVLFIDNNYIVFKICSLEKYTKGCTTLESLHICSSILRLECQVHVRFIFHLWWTYCLYIYIHVEPERGSCFYIILYIYDLKFHDNFNQSKWFHRKRGDMV